MTLTVPPFIFEVEDENFRRSSDELLQRGDKTLSDDSCLHLKIDSLNVKKVGVETPLRDHILSIPIFGFAVLKLFFRSLPQKAPPSVEMVILLPARPP